MSYIRLGPAHMAQSKLIATSVPVSAPKQGSCQRLCTWHGCCYGQESYQGRVSKNRTRAVAWMLLWARIVPAMTYTPWHGFCFAGGSTPLRNANFCYKLCTLHDKNFGEILKIFKIGVYFWNFILHFYSFGGPNPGPKASSSDHPSFASLCLAVS